MKKIFCFGELLLRMSPEVNRRWIHEATLPVFLGGAELNVATALAKWGLPAKYVTALPDNYLAKEIIEELESKNIDVSGIHLSGNRIGIYYMPQGADLKNAAVIYDRNYSSFSELKTGMLNWDELLKDCDWFHFTAISPALNAEVAAVCKEGLEAASRKGLTISADLNYRAKLWKYGKNPAEVMPELIKYCKVVMGNIWAAETLMDIPTGIADSTNLKNEQLIKYAEESMLNMRKTYPGIETIAYTFRMEEKYFAVLQQEKEIVVSKEHQQGKVIDKSGSGDCFMAGLIYGLYHQHPSNQIIEFAAAAAVGKMQEKGDATNQTIENINKKIN